jgi:hypothetical protein
MRFEVIKEHKGVDNCWNYPSIVTLKVGDVLEPIDEYSTESGHRFCRLIGTNTTVHPHSIKTRHPYDEGMVDTEYLKELPCH